MGIAELLSTALQWLVARRSQQVVVTRVVGPLGEDLVGALDLYERRLPENERDSIDNIVRWQAEFEAGVKDNRTKFDDYLLIAKCGGQVCGLLYAQYYHRTRLLLVSYLISDDRIPQKHRIVPAIRKKLATILKTELAACAGIVFELEHPDFSKRPRRCRGRQRLFTALALEMGMVVKRLGIDYKQPRLSLWDPSYSEEPQVLMYARRRAPALDDSIPKGEVVHILDTLYNSWYGDCYEDNTERDSEYRAYLRSLFQNTVSQMPDRVPLM
ncbi:MAG TPA: hypothetical protein VJ793_04220 [Anaerolineae bacterium]|nr:hypothetical protein [Anaerolineae bacterium]